MLTEFALLTALTLNSDEREVLRDKINEWVKLFLPKLERESTRTEKCRLIASVERNEFGYHSNAAIWRFCKFVGKNGIIFYENKRQIQKFKATSLQKNILRRNPTLKNVFLDRSEIKKENGNWNLKNELKDELLSEGGEAIVLNQKFGENLMALRVAVFDSFLFTKQFGAGQIKFRTHLISDFGTATNDEIDDVLVVPVHENIIRNFANIEIYDSGDEKEEDCLGWISIMEKCDGNLREKLKNGNATLKERKKIATGIAYGLDYLVEVGIGHCDKKLANFLLIGDVVKVCDFGLVMEFTGRKSYRKLGYARRGSKYINRKALFAGTPGFAGQNQLGVWIDDKNDYFLFLFCDWKTIWSLNYRPIDRSFNITYSYKRDSDIVRGYGSVQNILRDFYYDHKTGESLGLSHEEHLSKIIDWKNSLKGTSEKNLHTAWFVSNCDHTDGAVKRWEQGKKMMEAGLEKHLLGEGKCFDGPTDRAFSQNDIRKIKWTRMRFYLAFENAIHCTDYISEKFWRNSLTATLVPVVFGPHYLDIAKVAPPNSFIHADRTLSLPAGQVTEQSVHRNFFSFI
ncbi:unnamed protein product [Oikopleura dioica]|uniref:Fucosyltransferase n=1 Tax=Oikopleura dioica TaxID=34765 RepID=E4XLA5_OIKDI|nr:unnamed protein product [Oikopleura dioica]